MSVATLPQAISLLTRFNDKKISLERLESHFDAGLVSDLLDVDPKKVDRAAFRKVIGHPEALPVVVESPPPDPTIVELGEFVANCDETIAAKLAAITDAKQIGFKTDWATDEKFPDVRKGMKRFKASAVHFGRLMPQADVEQWCVENKKILALPKDGIDITKASPRPKLDNVMPLAIAGQFFVLADGARGALCLRRYDARRNLSNVWLNPDVQWDARWWFLVLQELPSAA